MSEYLEDDYVDDGYADDYVDEDFNDFWQEQLQKTPWWMISLVVHTIAAFIATLIVFEKAPEKPEYEYIAEIQEVKKEEVKPEPKRDVFKKTKPVKENEPTVEDPVVKEAKVSDHNESNDNEENFTMKGNEEAAANSPLKANFDSSFIGAGGGAGGKFGTRFGGKADLVKEGGGSAATESAVKAGLEWLKRHQADDGGWDADGFISKCGSDPKNPGECDGAGYQWVDPGVTGLALLCFLGAGNTATTGEFKDVVRKAQKYLKSIQDEEGCFGKKQGHYMYNHSIAALAMAEAYALSNYNPLLRSSAQKGIDYLVKSQNPGKAWRYSYQCGDNDTSVTGWAVMALKSAKVAELEVPDSSFTSALVWVDEVTDEHYYRTGYIQKGDTGSRLQGVEGFSRSEAMTAAAMTSRVFSGTERTDARLHGGGALLSNSLPAWEQDAQGQSLVDFYYWYYGTLAMYQMGGDFWQTWNDKMKKALVENQKTSQCVNGSWDSVDPWGKAGGRVYSTAINVLSLEIYYRYAKVFGAK
ncbi:prenyltransferase/squalene oxidase repeat-containing protein [Candidatus Uabimicrobium amorphum]|uniref:Squalene cyclase C-terminal domain-containing protein n=1 Tax=Uabimicrobium amorphum TaxID=2596890 RepID=A0A5S9ILR9_UABAM|nr:prenyltransferase/squalene oxidase repeat-containing protein [Candidatus Uabimicrobium amorphum]BBM84054.1 hypothetical protein UABAM_02409 [Candidatus Uabimicrobium amorphum]